MDQTHNFGNSITIVYLKDFHILFYIEASEELDKLQILGPHSRVSDSASLKWGPRICIPISFPGDSDAVVLKPNPEIMLTGANANLKVWSLLWGYREDYTSSWFNLICHDESGKRKKVGKWQREKVGCFTLGSLEAEAETGILVQAKGVREAR